MNDIMQGYNPQMLNAAPPPPADKLISDTEWIDRTNSVEYWEERQAERGAEALWDKYRSGRALTYSEYQTLLNNFRSRLSRSDISKIEYKIANYYATTYGEDVLDQIPFLTKNDINYTRTSDNTQPGDNNQPGGNDIVLPDNLGTETMGLSVNLKTVAIVAGIGLVGFFLIRKLRK